MNNKLDCYFQNDIDLNIQENPITVLATLTAHSNSGVVPTGSCVGSNHVQHVPAHFNSEWLNWNRRGCYVWPVKLDNSGFTYRTRHGKDPEGGGGIEDIMRSHISKWIVETVKEAYTGADKDRVTAHEERVLSASWVYNCRVALPDILSAAYRRLLGVFQNSYLRDMASIADGMSTLGPVVVAQQVVDPGHLPRP